MNISKQEDSKDCGLHVIQSLLKHFHNKTKSIEDLRMESRITQDGLSAKSLIDLADKNGIDLEGYEASIDDIKYLNDYFVSLVFKNGYYHYHIARIKNDKIISYDSIDGKKIYSFNEYQKIYQYKIFVVRPKTIKNLDNSKIGIWKNLLSHKTTLIWIIIISLFGVGLTFGSSLFTKIIIDKVIPTRNNYMLVTLCVSFIGILLISCINKVIKSIFLKKLAFSIELKIKNDFINSLNNSKFNDLNKISKVKLLRNYSIIEVSSQYFSSLIFAVLNEVITAIVAMGFLIWISSKLFFIVFGFGTLVFIFSAIFYILIKEKKDDVINSSIKVNYSTFDLININYSFANIDDRKWEEKKWMESFISENKSKYSFWKILNTQFIIDYFLSSVLTIIITLIASLLIFERNLTVGTMVMFNIASRYYISPIREISNIILEYPSQKRYYELIEGVVNLNKPINNDGKIKIDEIESININNLKFGFDKKILDINSLNINESIRLIGKNGTGKSTLLRIISNNIVCKGEIKYSNYKLEDLDHKNLKEKIIYISPSSYLPTGSIYDYITMNSINRQKKFFENCNNFKIIDLMNEMNLNLNDQIINNGENFSSGQRQFILFLRYFSSNYSLIILDEAFENVHKDIIKKISNFIDRQKIWIQVSSKEKTLVECKEVYIEEINRN